MEEPKGSRILIQPRANDSMSAETLRLHAVMEKLESYNIYTPSEIYELLDADGMVLFCHHTVPKLHCSEYHTAQAIEIWRALPSHIREAWTNKTSRNLLNDDSDIQSFLSRDRIGPLNVELRNLMSESSANLVCIGDTWRYFEPTGKTLFSIHAIPALRELFGGAKSEDEVERIADLSWMYLRENVRAHWTSRTAALFVSEKTAKNYLDTNRAKEPSRRWQKWAVQAYADYLFLSGRDGWDNEDAKRIGPCGNRPGSILVVLIGNGAWNTLDDTFVHKVLTGIQRRKSQYPEFQLYGQTHSTGPISYEPRDTGVTSIKDRLEALVSGNKPVDWVEKLLAPLVRWNPDAFPEISDRFADWPKRKAGP